MKEYTIANLNFNENPKFQAYLDKLGVSDLKNVKFKIQREIIDRENKKWILEVRITGDNVDIVRRATFTPEDLTSGEKTYFLNHIEKADAFLLREVEFSSAQEVT